MAAFSRRFDASYRDAAKILEDGTIDKPFLVRSQKCDLLDTTGFFEEIALCYAEWWHLCGLCRLPHLPER